MDNAWYNIVCIALDEQHNFDNMYSLWRCMKAYFEKWEWLSLSFYFCSHDNHTMHMLHKHVKLQYEYLTFWSSELAKSSTTSISLLPSLRVRHSEATSRGRAFASKARSAISLSFSKSAISWSVSLSVFSNVSLHFSMSSILFESLVVLSCIPHAVWL